MHLHICATRMYLYKNNILIDVNEKYAICTYVQNMRICCTGVQRMIRCKQLKEIHIKQHRKYGELIRRKQMSEVIEARNIKLNVEASDWRDSMIKSGQLLVDSEYITKDYIDLTIKCVEENGPYIVIIPGLALSHSRPDVSVKKTGLSLITLSKPVCFDCDNDPVDIVLTLAATDDTSHLEKLQSMAEFISDEDNIEFIKNAKTAEEVAKAINEFEPEE